MRPRNLACLSAVTLLGDLIVISVSVTLSVGNVYLRVTAHGRDRFAGASHVSRLQLRRKLTRTNITKGKKVPLKVHFPAEDINIHRITRKPASPKE